MPPMASTSPKAAAGSVGTVETQYLDLPGPLPLDCGRELPEALRRCAVYNLSGIRHLSNQG